MHPTLDLIRGELTALATQVKSSVPNNEPLNIVHSNWSFPGITRDELVSYATIIVHLIDQYGGDSLGTNEAILADYVRRLTFLRAQTVPQLWGNAAAAVSAYTTTLGGLRNVLEETFKNDQTIEDKKVEAAKLLKRTLTALRAIEARTSDIDSRSANLKEKVENIEQAHEAADQLPEDLKSLAEKRKALEGLLNDSTTDRKLVGEKLAEITAILGRLNDSDKKAGAVLERCDKAYRATTSEGLASAFAERSRSLGFSMWIWVVGLIAALVVGASIGSNQLHELAKAITDTATQGNRQDGSVWVELILTVLSIGAPVWFAWVATKQIGQRFRLAEDYGYKASIATAYEGYRREAELLDPAFQSRLFSSALTRLDEVPLRLVETDTHGSPWHELASSNVVRQALETVPEFMGKVTELAKQVLPQGGKANVTEQAAPKAAD